MSTKKTVAGVTIEPLKRKKNAPRTAYSKEHPSPHAVRPGQSGNPGGKARLVDVHLSRSLRIVLADRAPDDVCTSLGLPTHSTWSLCLARRLVYMAVKGDLAALVEIRTATEGNRLSADLSFLDATSPVPVVELRFLTSDGDGRPAREVSFEGYELPMPLELPAEVSD